MVGALAILGTPPFGVFAGEFLILNTTIHEQPWATPILGLALLVAFAAVIARVQPMVFGESTALRQGPAPAPLPLWLHLGLVLLLGLYIPPYVVAWYEAAAALIGGSP
jgi:formate hydrogenlyase subunit 3/multisubunit Na+/H+ antiporter MnhD subunit